MLHSDNDTGPMEMKSEDARRLLDRIVVLKNLSDLDLLVFFARHPRSLLASESLAAFLGYDLQDIAESLETLLSAGLLKRTQTPAHAARMYVFAADSPGGGWLPSLLRLASTRPGRLALREVLASRSPQGTGPARALAEARTTSNLVRARSSSSSSWKPTRGTRAG